MANDGFIEFLTPDALAQLKQASEIVDKLVPQIEKISKFKAPTTPSGADNSAKQMEADLAAAIAVLPPTKVQKGRVTKYAAQALWGKVLLYQGKYDAAAAMLENVISGPFNLVTNFGDIFFQSGFISFCAG